MGTHNEWECRKGVPVLNARGSQLLEHTPAMLQAAPQFVSALMGLTMPVGQVSLCVFSRGLGGALCHDAAAGSWIPWCMGEDGRPRFMSAGSQNVTIGKWGLCRCNQVKMRLS